MLIYVLDALVLLWTLPLTCCLCEFNLVPMPLSCSISNMSRSIDDPCSIFYHLVGIPPKDRPHFQELIAHYQLKSFNCRHSLVDSNQTNAEYTVEITVNDTSLRSVFTAEEERYQLNADQQKAEIFAPTYVGFVRAIQTFSQLFSCWRFRTRPARLPCTLTRLPIAIVDRPRFVHRGLMIDTSRHFLPLASILETIDAMMYNKMNVLHWHITDEDSFPLLLKSRPELAEYGAFTQDEVYTTDEAKEVVRYAMVRGVRVIPEVDTPAHAASWGKAPTNTQYACNRGYMGTLDVTLDGTYQLVEHVFREVIEIFPDPVIHLGGDEVVLMCLMNRTEVVKSGNISDDLENLELYYRQRQRQIIRKIDPTKKAVYWSNTNNTKLFGDQDQIQWWAQGGFPQTDRKVVISHYGRHYLDMGAGSYLGTGYGMYLTWLDIYKWNLEEQLADHKNKDNVLGAEVCLWSEVSNRYTHHTKIWARTSAFAERLWNPAVKTIKPGVLRRLTAHERLMNRKGIPTAPLTSQQCELHAEYC